MTTYDTCIVGQGLAGTTLAWMLHRQGERVAVVDQHEPNSSSRIAAGLITPVTGKRFVKSKQFDLLWQAAVAFYRDIETETKTTFFKQNNSIRLFASQEERELLSQKSISHFPNLVQISEHPVNEKMFDTTYGGFEMKQAARLNTRQYLNTSREYFSRQQSFFESEIDPETDLQLTNEFVRIPMLGLTASRVIFCQGFTGSKNKWFQTVPFDAAQGEILTVRIPDLNEPRVVHRGIWLASMGDDLYRVGATYNHDQLDTTPTKTGRDELCSRLAEFLHLPFEVIDQHAAVRPIIVGRKPAIGFHPHFPQLGYFNGLGSKGSLQAPWFAQLFADVISKKRELPAEFHVAKHLNLQKITT